jgi:hypothetical protein
MLTLLLEGLGHHVVFQVAACLLMKDDGAERRGRHFHGRQVQAILTKPMGVSWFEEHSPVTLLFEATAIGVLQAS